MLDDELDCCEDEELLDDPLAPVELVLVCWDPALAEITPTASAPAASAAITERRPILRDVRRGLGSVGWF